jgi:hypothetical protein
MKGMGHIGSNLSSNDRQRLLRSSGMTSFNGYTKRFHPPLMVVFSACDIFAMILLS